MPFSKQERKRNNRIKWLLFMAFHGKIQGRKMGKSLSQVPQLDHNEIWIQTTLKPIKNTGFKLEKVA